ncbi:MAG TPA: N-acetyltransferase [Clostridium sp.]|nr:N-acetyltransferase [Clostridium sp.]
MIKKLTTSNLDTVMKIWLKTNIETHSFIPKEYWQNNFEMVKEVLPQADVYVFEEDEIIKGFIGIVDVRYIAGIFVKKEYQEQGIGHELLEFCKDKYKKLSLDVFVKNEKAINFYIKNDFKISTKKLNEGTNEEEYFMNYGV